MQPRQRAVPPRAVRVFNSRARARSIPTPAVAGASVTPPRGKKRARKTNLALVDFVIYALFSYVARARPERNKYASCNQIRSEREPGVGTRRRLVPGCCSSATQIPLHGQSRGRGRVVSRSASFYARHVSASEISHSRRSLAVVGVPFVPLYFTLSPRPTLCMRAVRFTGG